MGLEEMASPLFGVWKALLNGERFEQTGRGVVLILAYQKSFRRPYLSAQTFGWREDS